MSKELTVARNVYIMFTSTTETERNENIMKISKSFTIADIEEQIDNGTALPVKAANFTDGDEDEKVVTFYRLWGSLVQKIHDLSKTTREYFFVDGNELDLFNAHYGVR